MKPFEKWKTEEVRMTFGIRQVETHQLMQDWCSASFPEEEKHKERIEELRIRLNRFANFWSEEDIKVFFIIPIIDIVNFYAFGKYRAFMEATISARTQDIHGNLCELRGRVEFVVATGEQDPQTPFFFLNEYKPQIKAVSDPQGQLLIAMLAAQAKNNGKNLPIYGLYNIGQLWFFIIMQGQEYVSSKAFDATDAEDLKQIINMLRYVKAHIERNV
ncbi:MAG: hypothetical protein EAZ85_06885 [Bacteroidetes bacterium]|nr:MAG: hypothetical protein EAZ85_06885 [Bacteroidota bacterium]TAG89544.1 MAG: hypothetical protein EAZ20_06290 [Bacteroidota bacterium]